jgi:hypothetical protein
VRQHGAPEQLDCGVLLSTAQLQYLLNLWKALHETAVWAVKRLADPAAERKATTFEKRQQLRHRVGSVLRIEQRVSHGRRVAEIGVSWQMPVGIPPAITAAQS